MKLLAVVLIIVLICPPAFAAKDRNNDKSPVVVVDAYGETVGTLVQYFDGGGARVVMAIDGQNTLVWLHRQDGIGTSWPPGPMLFFDGEGCTGQAYARVEHVDAGWMSPRIVIVPGFVPEGHPPSSARMTYRASASNPDVYNPVSHLSPEGHCFPFDPPDVFAWPVVKVNACKFSDDLHACYPPPYELHRD